MPFKLPDDLITELQTRFPGVDIPAIIHATFEGIIQRTFTNGNTTIREFGEFFAYKVFSTRLQQEAIRFKFKMTSALQRKIKSDQFILNQLKLREKNPFTDEHEQKCKDKKELRNQFQEIRYQINKENANISQDVLARNVILSIIEEGNQ